ncbi:MAG: hypothetical protein AAF399_02665 [Bacteroidota bacterium]
MGLSTLQIVITTSMVGIAVAGIIFILQDARAHKRRMNEFAQRRTRRTTKEHEPA